MEEWEELMKERSNKMPLNNKKRWIVPAVEVWKNE
jgi:hypothetical protein